MLESPPQKHTSVRRQRRSMVPWFTDRAQPDHNGARVKHQVDPKAAILKKHDLDDGDLLKDATVASRLLSAENGSPAPRLTSVCRDSQHQQTPRHTDKSYEEGLSIRYTQPHSYAERMSGIASSPPAMPIRETQTDDDIVAMARDRYLQDFQQKKPRERKSLFFGSVQKLQKCSLTDLRHDRGSTRQDSSARIAEAVNSAAPLGKSTDAAHQGSPLPGMQGSPAQNPRGVSGLIKERFSKLFRKPSRVPSGLPAQQVRAETLHHPVLATGSPIDEQHTDNTSDPFVMMSLETPTVERGPPQPIIDSVGSRLSVGYDSTDAKSRVTSWTNSTAADTMSTQGFLYNPQSVDEHGRMRRVSSISTLRKKSSFFGRAIQTRLRKASRADMASSEKSQVLFEALRDRSRQPEQTPSISTSKTNEDNVLGPVHDRSSLPPQVSQSVDPSAGTVRTIRSEVELPRPQMMSPVIEASPDRAPQRSSSPSTTPTQRNLSTTRTKRPSTMYAKVPTQEHIARRMQRAQNRWQGPLDAASPAAERHFSGKYVEDNPYELPSLGRNVYYEPVKDTGGLPRRSRVSETRPVARDALISPSLYSRASDDASPRPTSPEGHGGTLITVTSRSVKRYELSPPKQRATAVDQPVQGSREWRKWLSDELQTFAESPNESDDRPRLQQEMLVEEGETSAVLGKQDHDSRRPMSKRHTSDSPPATGKHKDSKNRRSRATSRRSSYMNERFPMIESSRNSSRQSQSRQSARNSRKISSIDSERPVHTSRGEDVTQPSSEVFVTHATADRTLRTHRSAVAFQHTNDSDSVLKSISYQSAQTSQDVPNTAQSAKMDAAQGRADYRHEPSVQASSKAKSAFDLRASYKVNAIGATRSIDAHRKMATVPIFDDNTIRNISAGPYGPQTTGKLAPWTDTTNRENTPPRDQESLPALSSSEWLAGPTSKKSVSTLNGQQTTTARYSSPTKLPYAGGNGGSPGQRLATGWLEERVSKSGENSPAFV
ncbi:hypothetical protein B0A48_11013 [Cryoendolithus antarcticus]|uniref:Uncharacterized protein n=1 Tax=Cryoendolithus antarcticus TaxID=1507870 RepID=A0A1V8SZS6_9PEZI|nr:hypothetical protein B0A48_11013 [Cryoendolithus antarcticus]